MWLLDFDGAITLAEVEGIPYRLAAIEEVAKYINMGFEEALALAERFEAIVMAEPHKYPWRYNGLAVGPASVDPYLRMVPVGIMLMNEAGVFKDDPAAQENFMVHTIYPHNYKKTSIAFKPDAKDFLNSLDPTRTLVITNSSTDAVINKIKTLGPQFAWLQACVIGNARKFEVIPNFTDINQEEMWIPGLERPILLRRQNYFMVISDLCDRFGITNWSDITVLGDIFEFDGVLPLWNGCRFVHTVNQFTPPYEIDFLEGHRHGHVVRSLTEAINLI